MPSSVDILAGYDPSVASVISDSTMAPSAHNTQPWLIIPRTETEFSLVHQGGVYAPKPARLAGLLNAGVYVGHMGILASKYNVGFRFEPQLDCHEDGRIDIGVVSLEPGLGEEEHPLAASLQDRHTNRNAYDPSVVVDDRLISTLRGYGNAILKPMDVIDLVREASKEMLLDIEIVRDLKEWFRDEDSSPDGITPGPFNLPAIMPVLLKMIDDAGCLPDEELADHLGYFSDDAKVFATASNALVIGSEDESSEAVFDAGKRLMLSWAVVFAAGYSYHPHSGPAYMPTVWPKLAQVPEVKDAGIVRPLAVTRIGSAIEEPAARSKRRPPEQFIRAA